MRTLQLRSLGCQLRLFEEVLRGKFLEHFMFERGLVFREYVGERGSMSSHVCTCVLACVCVCLF